ncbi:DUF2157 domain-containing protein [Nocardioides sp.]|uniref:DUF2157 domain-containing protein n=1 Tax=Nocardioides sp. TaxID=35761 RepID=UPI0027376EA1|nr:DUF2157 domain-containing protein [Nocardioides sp.]MDP3891151.1 DUF2157 domain-containing protein [Nocardioides sp.]
MADQLITPEQADRILVRGDVVVQTPSAAQERPPERSPLIIEALGYLGGVIILVASSLIASLYWDQVATAARLVIVGGVAAVLLAAGFAVPERLKDVGVRFRSVVWLLSTGAFSGFVGMLGADALNMAAEDVFQLTSSCVAAYAAGLWLISRTLVQQLTLMVGAMLTAAALTNALAASDALPGFAVWGVALVWLLLGWGGLLEPSRLVMVCGAAGMFIGAMTTIPAHAGIVLALVTAAAVVSTAVLFRDLLLLAVGALGTLQVLPASVIELFPGDLAAPIALLVVGTLLVGAGLFIARRRHIKPETGPPAHDFSVGTPVAAITAAGVVGTTVTAAIVTLAVI